MDTHSTRKRRIRRTSSVIKEVSDDGDEGDADSYQNGDTASKHQHDSGKLEVDKIAGGSSRRKALLRRFTNREIQIFKEEFPLDKKHKYLKKRFIFIVGALAGLIIAAFLFKPEQIDFDRLIENVDVDKFLDDVRTALPSSILQDALSFTQKEKEKGTFEHGDFAAGMELSRQGISAQKPIVMIPGVISTGLESWSTAQCALPYFRKRLWGSWTMLRAMLLDKQCWRELMVLDAETGLDPPNTKIRAAQGFDAADFFIGNYWIWNKIVQNLAAIGYDPNTMFSAAYDWRLSYINLETRDRYFTKLKRFIELSVESTGKKSVIVSHSMGSQVIFWFFKWVEAEGHGNGGPTWCEDHIDSLLSLSGSFLGTPKAVTALLSGEMRDTAQLNAFSVYGLEKFYSKKERAEILRLLPGISSMLPKGGDTIWGNATWAPDDTISQIRSSSFGSFLKFQNKVSRDLSNRTMSQAFDYLEQHTSTSFRNLLASNYSHGVARSRAEVEENDKRPEKWINPLESRLPFAPSMRIYCLYGVGKPTERSYWYEEGDIEETLNQQPSMPPTISNFSVDMPYGIPYPRPAWIDSSVSSKPVTEKGVVMGEGDGTVSLLSSGFMCVKGWKMPRYNPANISVYTYEMKHQPTDFDIRGGPKTAGKTNFFFCSTELTLCVVRSCRYIRTDGIE